MVFEVSSIEGLEQQKKKYYHDRLVESGLYLPPDFATQDFETMYFKLLNAGAIRVPGSSQEVDLAIQRRFNPLYRPTELMNRLLNTTEKDPIYPGEPVFSSNASTSAFLTGVGGSTSAYANLIPYDPAKRYRWSMRAKGSIPGIKTFFQATWRKHDGSHITNAPYIFERIDITTDWKTYIGYTGPTAPDIVPPEGVQGIAPVIYFNHVSGTQDGTMYVSNVQLLEVG